MEAKNIKIYGRPISDFLLPDQIEFIDRYFAEPLIKNKNTAMTPKEKAHELHSKFFKVVDYNNSTSFEWGFKTAKTCALIVVDESLDVLDKCDFEHAFKKGYEKSYWYAVKREIEEMPMLEAKLI